MANLLVTKYEVIIGTDPADAAPSLVLSTPFRTKAAANQAATRLLAEIAEGTVEVTIPPGSNVWVREVVGTLTTNATTFEEALADVRAARVSVNVYVKLQSGTTIFLAALPPGALEEAYNRYGR